LRGLIVSRDYRECRRFSVTRQEQTVAAATEERSRGGTRDQVSDGRETS
jgi:hypothetical protein